MAEKGGEEREWSRCVRSVMEEEEEEETGMKKVVEEVVVVEEEEDRYNSDSDNGYKTELALSTLFFF